MEPNRLELQFKHHIAMDGELAFSTAWLGVDIAVGVNGGFLIMNSVDGSKQKTRSGPNIISIHSVQSVGNFALVALCKVVSKKMYIRLSCSHLLSNKESTVYEFEQEDGLLTHMALSKTYIAVCD